MLFAAAAIASGGVGTPGPPCHVIAEQWEPNIRCAEPGRYTVTAALRDQLLGEPMILDRDARVVPAIKNGAPSGFKVYAIRPGSLLAALGLENGDRIHTVAGVTVTDMSSALQLPAVLRTSDRFTIEIERRGREVALRYEVR
jgi:general secretion pathway protein C